MNRDDIIKRIEAKNILRGEKVKPLTDALLAELIKFAEEGKHWHSVVVHGEFDLMKHVENYDPYIGPCGCMGPMGFTYCNCEMIMLLDEYKWNVLLELTKNDE